jgi:dTDP-glucose 4,6-dehydratase
MATKKTPAKAERSGNAQVRTRQASSKAPVASAHRIDKPSATRKPPAKRATTPAKASAKRGAHTPKERVLITGAAGFLGSHLCDRFLKEGYHVIGMDNLITGSLKNIEHLFKREDFEFYSHDVSKFVHVPGELKYILHFASPASPIDYEKIPIQTLKVGSLGTHNLLGLALAKKARILVASTSEVYGDPKVHPQPESYWGHVNPVGKRSMYDEAKRFQEAITMAYHHYHGLETRMVRIFNTYGPRMRLNDGRVVPAFMGQALRGEDLTIFGKGDQTRSFCYVDDLIEGIYRLLLSDHAGPVNIGNPKEITIKQFAQEILKLTGTKQKLIHKPLPSDDPMQRQPDITLAKKLLGWQPKVDRAEGMRRTYEYFKSLTPEELNEKEHFDFGKYSRK